jgi:hypothetical protein
MRRETDAFFYRIDVHAAEAAPAGMKIPGKGTNAYQRSGFLKFAIFLLMLSWYKQYNGSNFSVIINRKERR